MASAELCPVGRLSPEVRGARVRVIIEPLGRFGPQRAKALLAEGRRQGRLERGRKARK
jgi:hypothetical protein